MPHPSFNTAQKKAAILAGFALLTMALLAPIAFFVVLEPIRNAGDASAQIRALLDSGVMFRFSILIFLIVAVLDILLAWALHRVFAPLYSQLSLLAAWFRLIYTAVLLVATISLVQVLTLLQSPDSDNTFWQHLLLHEFNGFFTAFHYGLGVFGCHLVVLGYLIIRAELLPSLLGAFVVIAGLGYLMDTLFMVLAPQYDMSLASVTFIGEVLLIGWLFWWGFKQAHAPAY